jgi:hypothetical protein
MTASLPQCRRAHLCAQLSYPPARWNGVPLAPLLAARPSPLQADRVHPPRPSRRPGLLLRAQASPLRTLCFFPSRAEFLPSHGARTWLAPFPCARAQRPPCPCSDSAQRCAYSLFVGLASARIRAVFAVRAPLVHSIDELMFSVHGALASSTPSLDPWRRRSSSSHPMSGCLARPRPSPTRRNLPSAVPCSLPTRRAQLCPFSRRGRFPARAAVLS